ncbi:MAG: sulfatase [Phycisphaerae bacterium]
MTVLAVLIILDGGGLLGCAPDRAVESGPTVPNVILIVLDTLRADHLGCYGYDKATSPRIDAFAAESVLYEKALASAPWTVPTHASMFTGKNPFEHGAHTFRVGQPVNNVNSLHQRHTTLAETLQAEGFDTAAFVANDAFLGRRWKLDQGFDRYHVERAYAERLNEHIVRWLGDRQGRPFFLFINYIDVHWPLNTSPRPGFKVDASGLQNPEQLLAKIRRAVLPGTGKIPSDLMQQLTELYDLAIANLDEQVGALLDFIEGKGLGGNTLVVITSDHGEYFGEHHLIGHSKDVYQPALSIPLLIRAPGQAGGQRDKRLISSTDLPQLILSHFPQDFIDRRRRVFPDVPGNHLVLSENYFSRTKHLFGKPWSHRFWRIRTAVFDGSYKFIHSSDGQHELYDLQVDPTEKHNLYDVRRQVADQLLVHLEQFQDQRGRSADAPDTAPLTEEDIRRLKSLGYMGD